jgi:hypothetical protein
MGDLASMLDEQRKYEEVEELHSQTLELKEKLPGEEDHESLSGIDNLRDSYSNFPSTPEDSEGESDFNTIYDSSDESPPAKPTKSQILPIGWFVLRNGIPPKQP